MKLGSKAEKAELLSNVALFSECSKKELNDIAGAMEERRVQTGTVLAREGEPGDEFFAVAEGLVRATIDGSEIGSIRAGSFFGEMALLDGGPRSATVTAELPTRLLVLDSKSFSRLVKQSPSVALKIMKGLAQRLRELENTLT